MASPFKAVSANFRLVEYLGYRRSTYQLARKKQGRLKLLCSKKFKKYFRNLESPFEAFSADIRQVECLG